MTKEEVIKQLEKLIYQEQFLKDCSTIGELQHMQNIEALEFAKRAAEKEGRRGKWIKQYYFSRYGDGGTSHKCSLCGCEGDFYKKYNYCPNCGSAMVGDNDDS